MSRECSNNRVMIIMEAGYESKDDDEVEGSKEDDVPSSDKDGDVISSGGPKLTCFTTRSLESLTS